jgi:hypothetical protein
MAMIDKRVHSMAKFNESRTLCHEGCGYGQDCCLDRSFDHSWHICSDENCRCHEHEPIEGINPRSYIVRKGGKR